MFLATGCAAQLCCKQHKVVYIVSKHLGKDAHAIGCWVGELVMATRYAPSPPPLGSWHHLDPLCASLRA